MFKFTSIVGYTSCGPTYIECFLTIFGQCINVLNYNTRYYFSLSAHAVENTFKNIELGGDDCRAKSCVIRLVVGFYFFHALRLEKKNLVKYPAISLNFSLNNRSLCWIIVTLKRARGDFTMHCRYILSTRKITKF